MKFETVKALKFQMNKEEKQIKNTVITSNTYVEWIRAKDKDKCNGLIVTEYFLW